MIRQVVEWLNHNEGAVVGLGTLALAAFTASLWWSTRRLWKASLDQSREMKQSLATAARSAAASEGLAATAAANVEMIRQRSSQQMRAYLAVTIGEATFQERDKGYKFEARPNVVNTGFTPARHVNYVVDAAIMPAPPPADFTFPLPTATTGGGSLNPHQASVTVTGRVPDYIPDQDVASTKTGFPRALVVWGVVNYDDVFGDHHKTQFAQVYVWLPNGAIWGYYLPRHNEAD